MYNYYTICYMRYGGSKVLHLGKEDGLINVHCRTAAHVATQK